MKVAPWGQCVFLLCSQQFCLALQLCHSAHTASAPGSQKHVPSPVKLTPKFLWLLPLSLVTAWAFSIFPTSVGGAKIKHCSQAEFFLVSTKITAQDTCPSWCWLVGLKSDQPVSILINLYNFSTSNKLSLTITKLG